MIAIKNLTKKYEQNTTPTISNLSLDLPDTGIVTIVGKSGSGKSTLLRILGAIDLAYEGTVMIEGVNLKKCKSKSLSDLRAKKIGYSFQDDEFDLSQTVYDSLKWPLDIVKMEEASKKALIVSTLELVGLSSKIYQKLNTLSGGERKRVGIARAIILSPRIILLDEPLACIDIDNRLKMNELFKKLSANCLIIIVTHTQEKIGNESILECVDGKFAFITDNRDYKSVKKKTNLVRKMYSIGAIAYRACKTLWSHKTRAVLAYSSLVVGLISFGFSFIISEGVNKQVISSLQGSLDNNTMLIKKKTDSAYDDMLRGTEITVASKLNDSFHQTTNGFGTYYLANFEDMFSTKNAVYIREGYSTINMSYLTARHFANPFREHDLSYSFSRKLEYDEVVLVLKDGERKALEQFLNVSDVDEHVKRHNLTVHLDLAQAEMEYENECLFSVEGVMSGKENGILVNNDSWNINFVEETLGLTALDTVEIEPVKPWEVRKSSYISVENQNFLEFYDSFIKREEYMNLTLEKTEQFETRYYVFSDVTNKLSSYEVYDVYQSLNSYAKSYSLSSGVYGYAADGRYNGFMKPVFFSSEREKLNRLADANYSSSIDLEAFQSSSFNIPNGVLVSDLATSIKGEGIGFVGYDDNPPIIQVGKLPSNVNEILLSSTLFNDLFEYDFNKETKLQVTVLKETVFEGTSYKNKFIDVELTITGVFSSKKQLISQKTSFPISLMISLIGVNADKVRVSGGMIVLENNLNHDSLIKQLNVIYPTIEFSFPLDVLVDGVNEATNVVSMALMAFSSFSTLISISLLTLVLLLLVLEDKKSIGIYLVHGYRKRDILIYYVGLISLIVLIALTSAFISIVFISITSLGDISLLTIFKTTIYMILLSLFIIIVCSLIIYLKISRKSIMDAFNA